MGTRSMNVLLVEDNPADVRLTCEALRETSLDCDMKTVSDGEEAISYLRRRGEYAEADRPDLILLDLNLPRKSGREVLSEVKRDPTLSSIPVVVLSTSRATSDIAACYDMHANAYVAKPTDYDQFLRLVTHIGTFWGETARLPRQPA
jgi:CheY-like chemotaxis protein